MSTTRTVSFSALPADAQSCLAWTWDDYQPYFGELLSRSLDADSTDRWLRDLTTIVSLLQEQGARLQNIYSHDTRVPESLRQLEEFQQGVLPQATVVGQRLRELLLASGVEPDGMEFPLRQMRA